MLAIIDVALENQAKDEGVMLVAVDDRGLAVGNVTVTRERHRLRRHRARLGGFVLHPSAQGSGLARQLVRVAAEWCHAHSCTVLEVDCRGGTHAEDAYAGLGFHEWGRLPAGLIEEAGVFDQVNFWVRVEDWLRDDQERANAPSAS